MFILTIDGKEKDGAYSVQNEDGDHLLYSAQPQLRHGDGGLPGKDRMLREMS